MPELLPNLFIGIPCLTCHNQGKETLNNSVQYQHGCGCGNTSSAIFVTCNCLFLRNCSLAWHQLPAHWWSRRSGYDPSWCPPHHVTQGSLVKVVVIISQMWIKKVMQESWGTAGAAKIKAEKWQVLPVQGVNRFKSMKKKFIYRENKSRNSILYLMWFPDWEDSENRGHAWIIKKSSPK